jgi:hypothetical protein
MLLNFFMAVRSRERYVSLAGKAYTSISVRDFAGYVGLPEPEAVQVLILWISFGRNLQTKPDLVKFK